MASLEDHYSAYHRGHRKSSPLFYLYNVLLFFLWFVFRFSVFGLYSLDRICIDCVRVRVYLSCFMFSEFLRSMVWYLTLILEKNFTHDLFKYSFFPFSLSIWDTDDMYVRLSILYYIALGWPSFPYSFFSLCFRLYNFYLFTFKFFNSAASSLLMNSSKASFTYYSVLHF